MASDDTLTNALIGAVASVVLVFLPFSPALGGALAGYLQGPDTDEGLRVGALSGVIAAVPIALLAVLAGAFFLAVAPSRAAVVFLLFVVVALLFALAYAVGLGALGGLLGSYLREEFEGPTGTPPERLGRDPSPEATEFHEPTVDDEPVTDDEPTGSGGGKSTDDERLY
ncbi:DUF5518 domain-containing protein [Halorarum salinum]|uniref:DUF5518 domain-containing protein n=1 Tax=Halorarum salinum TaxID=2743089 RepID=A0A7D5L9J3_9EURY|nr:DUF5518 domain-containing protein [Halobaculum salinum]QLG60895.1 DUF5518 domain-containing protein [Halobaculum salinum]